MSSPANTVWHTSAKKSAMSMIRTTPMMILFAVLAANMAMPAAQRKRAANEQRAIQCQANYTSRVCFQLGPPMESLVKVVRNSPMAIMKRPQIPTAAAMPLRTAARGRVRPQPVNYAVPSCNVKSRNPSQSTVPSIECVCERGRARVFRAPVRTLDLTEVVATKDAEKNAESSHDTCRRMSSCDHNRGCKAEARNADLKSILNTRDTVIVITRIRVERAL